MHGRFVRRLSRARRCTSAPKLIERWFPARFDFPLRSRCVATRFSELPLLRELAKIGEPAEQTEIQVGRGA